MGFDIFEQLLQSRAVEISAGEATIIIMIGNQGPAEMLLAFDIRFGGLALCMKRIEVLIETLLGGFAGVNGTANRGSALNDDRADWSETWALFPGSVAYVWHAGKHASTVQQSLERADFEIRSQIIWAKNRFALSRGHYHWQHEPCWYAVKGETNWAGDRSQSTLWSINVETLDTNHGTQKPVECMRRPVTNNSSPGHAVYEPFSGSGTTIIACEQTGRACHAIELSPAYVDLAAKRWQDYTGQKAILEATGELFDELAGRKEAVTA